MEGKQSWLIVAAHLAAPILLRVLLVVALTLGAARELLPAGVADACLAVLGQSVW